ncbi:MAG TPA: DNA-protecting protein DprA [Firmicutes bacterium]|nr:DNA-protecting protein DprA [Bacillota bacterium]
MKRSSREYLIAFNMVSGIGGRRLFSLKKHFGSLEKAWRAPLPALLKVPGIGRKTAAHFCKTRGKICPTAEEAWAKREGARIITIGEAGYPKFLERLFVPPPVLYCRGSLPRRAGIAVVGTRKPSQAGIRQAYDFSSALAKNNLPIISGLARGIDSYAHRGALAAGGITAAVLGSNIGDIYPPEHRALADKIAQRGAVISEFSSRCRIMPGNFLRRNRIIAGLARAVLVVQAGERSGAVNTANWGLELGLDIWAIPGEISDPRRRGTNNLIKQGAFLAESAADLMKNLGV